MGDIKRRDSMGKFDAFKRLSKKQIDELFIDFAKALASIHNAIDAANLIKDLLTEPEVVMFARRLQIARLLDQNYTYDQIHKVMRVGNTTVAKVHTWMNLHGDGFQMVIKRTKSQPENKEIDAHPLSWAKHKRKYPLYYWPELLLKEIVKSANAREKKRLLDAVTQMKEKTRITREIMQLLQPGTNSYTPAYGRK